MINIKIVLCLSNESIYNYFHYNHSYPLSLFHHHHHRVFSLTTIHTFFNILQVKFSLYNFSIAQKIAGMTHTFFNILQMKFSLYSFSIAQQIAGMVINILLVIIGGGGGG